jgi:hypothetical protein
LPDGTGGGIGQFSALQGQRAQPLEKQQSESAKPQSLLIAGHPVAAGAIGFQVQILLLNLVFGVTACTVKVFITLLGAEAIGRLRLVLKARGRQVGHDKTRIVFVL